MNRILVIGCGGAGKTTFSLELGERLSLEFLHYVATFRLTRLQSTLDKLKSYSESCKLIVLKEKTELTQFIECT